MRIRLALALALITFTALSQNEKLIVIEHADSLVGRTIDGEQAQELIGNVRFSQDQVHVQCDRAVQLKGSGNVQLYGNVVVHDDSLTMKFPRGMYLRDERHAVAYDSVHLDDGRMTLSAKFGEYFVDPKRAFFKTSVMAKDSESVLLADSLTYFRTEQKTIALGNVEIRNMPDGVTIRGGRFESLRKEDYGRMTEHPVLVQFDTSTSIPRTIDTLVVRSRVMESFRGDSVKRLIATDSVEIMRTDLASVAGLAEFYTQGDSILLRKSPFVWYEQTQVSGDSINVYLKKRKLHRVHVVGNTLAVSESDSLRSGKYDQITGEEMILHFGEQGMERMDVNTRAISVYHLYEDSTANGLNKTSGDRIVMLWEDKKLSSIRVFGGAEGEYVPENLTLGKEREYAVTNFVWREGKPLMQPSDFGFTRMNTHMSISR